MIWPGDQHLHRDGPVEERELGCPACGHSWYADGREEYGWWEPVNEDDLYCPCCGSRARREVRCDQCGLAAPVLKTVRPRSGGASLVLCDRCWHPIRGVVWVVPGPVACFGSCSQCGGWFSVRDLAGCTGGGKQGAPSGICAGCV